MHTRSHGGTPKTVRRQKWKKGPWSLLRFHRREWAGRIGTLSKLWDSLNSFGGCYGPGTSGEGDGAGTTEPYLLRMVPLLPTPVH